MGRFSAIVCALAAIGCRALPIAECSFLCASGGRCPSGATCGQDGYCHPEGSTRVCPKVSGDGGGVCLGCVDPTGGPYNLMFVTSGGYTPGKDYTGTSGADALCTQIAHGASLPGTYVAWLSDSKSNAIDRLNFNGVPASGWVRVDGRPIAASREDLLAGKFLFPPRISETGSDLVNAANTHAATATGEDGTLLAGVGTANDFTSSSGSCGVGVCYRTTSAWTRASDNPCAGSHLYCFGVDYNQPLTLIPVAGKKAFLSHTSFVPHGGVAAADALCQQEAGSANFLALLSTTQMASLSRFTDAGLPWVRSDGVPWAASYDDLRQGRILTSLNVDFNRGYTYSWAWMGARDPGSLAASMGDCGGWTSTSGSSVAGYTPSSSSELFYSAAQSCSDATTSVYCLER